MQSSKTLKGLMAGAALLLMGATASVAHAAPAAPAGTAPTTTTLPLLGVQLTVEVVTGPGGALTSVSVNPADGLTATTVKPNKVVFVNDAGTGKVIVSGHDGRQGVQVKAGALADVSGDGGWSGDVFGNGTTTTVGFTIGATADGGPDITNVVTSDTTAVIGATEYGDHDGHGHEDEHHQRQSASVKITFTNGGQKRSLGIRVELTTREDGTTRARAGVALGSLRGVVQPVADAIGIKTWTGQLCNGDTATITYTVNADGSLTDVTADPSTATITDREHGIEVRFSHDERVRIGTRVSDEGIKVSIRERIRCGDAPDPTVNTPTSTNPDDTNSDGDHHDSDHHDGDHHGDGGGHDGHHHG